MLLYANAHSGADRSVRLHGDDGLSAFRVGVWIQVPGGACDLAVFASCTAAGLFHFLGGLFSQAVAVRRIVAGDPAQRHLYFAQRDFSALAADGIRRHICCWAYLYHLV
ncbi:hypothetical protein SDC9_184712 [bioreactor metagenome]|uniref:Uncharacterized protein n=1 Tax=bioreactor metagenome TaxID=1076179 RepID=A0A645HF53_9ZZZZ